MRIIPPRLFCGRIKLLSAMLSIFPVFPLFFSDSFGAQLSSTKTQPESLKLLTLRGLALSVVAGRNWQMLENGGHVTTRVCTR